jgi:hypothetical protein
MNAISSLRPFRQDEECRRRTMTAYESWRQVFDQIHWFGVREPEMAHHGTQFFLSEPFPRILSLVRHCASLEGWSCIINSDIVLSADFPRIMRIMERRNLTAAISKRWEFQQENRGTKKFQEAKLVDEGLDIFIATQRVWKQVAEEFPAEFRIGHGLWDTAMLGAFNCIAKRGLADITRQKLVFHPNHGGRSHPVRIPEVKHRFLSRVGWPTLRL